MKEFNSSYVGIPLPELYQQSFSKLLATIRKIDPFSRVADPRSAHITLYYLGKQNEDVLSNEVVENVKTRLPDIKGLDVCIGGYGSFEEKSNEKVMFLQVKPHEELLEFNTSLQDAFDSLYPNAKNLQFHPHITVCRLDSRDFHILSEKEEELKMLFDDVKWKFPVIGIMVYGNNFQLNDIIPEDFVFSDD